MADDSPDDACTAMSARLARLFPRISRGLRRHQEQAAPDTSGPLGPRHVAALQQLLDGPAGVGDLAGRLGLTLPTVSGLVADLDRAGFVERRADRADRRRTIVEITEARRVAVDGWLDGAAAPLGRVLERLCPEERLAFLKAMDLLEEEVSAGPRGAAGTGACPLGAGADDACPVGDGPAGARPSETGPVGSH
jgi:DNA-binding MarR family transcriptional regulator